MSEPLYRVTIQKLDHKGEVVSDLVGVCRLTETQIIKGDLELVEWTGTQVVRGYSVIDETP